MYHIITDLQALQDYLSGAAHVAFDFETSPEEQWRTDPRAALDPHKAHITGISFSIAEGSAVYLPIAHMIGQNAADLPAVWRWLAGWFTDPAVTKIAHNLAFESAFLYCRGIVVQEPVYDTIAAAQLTLKSPAQFRTLGDCGLKTLVPQLFGAEMPGFEEVTAGRFFDELDPADLATVRYACADADYTLRLYHKLNAWLDRYLPRHRWIAEHVESPTSVYCGIMRCNGLLVDHALMEAKRAEAESRLEQLRRDIVAIIGDVPIGANANTSAFKRYLYKDLGLPVQKTTAKMQEAMDDEALVLLAEWCADHRPELVPLFGLVQDYRRWGKICSTYIDGYARYINQATGRIHADLLPLATETGRFAARNPNLQNMPRAGADPVGIRNFFVAPEGKALVSVDFSQIELRVGAFYCRDEKMLETYRASGDIHDATATVIFGPGKPHPNESADSPGTPKHDKEQRTIAKNVNFGTFFGLFPRGLQRTLKLKAGLNTPLEDCERIIANLKAGYPALARWQEETKRQAEIRRFSETWLGRRRYLPGITSSDWGVKSFAQRCALNTPIQGTAADLLKLAIGRILAGLPERPWLRPLLQIHDELVFEVPKERVAEAVSFIRQSMETQPFPEFDVPILAEAAVGLRFGDMKEMNNNAQ
jgi:DNA polymerase-1